MGWLNGPGSLTIAKVRQTVSGYLTGTAMIEAFTPTDDGAGGFTEQWTPVTNGTVACRVDPVTYAQLETVAAAEGLKITYHITLPYDAPIVEGNRITAGGYLVSAGSVVPLGSAGTYTGGTQYNVRTMAPQTTQLAFVRCLVQRNVT